jgi:hypothetical protein
MKVALTLPFLIGIVERGFQLGPFDTTATNMFIVSAPDDYEAEKFVKLWLTGEIEVLGENLPSSRFVHHKSYMLPGSESGPPGWEDSD